MKKCFRPPKKSCACGGIAIAAVCLLCAFSSFRLLLILASLALIVSGVLLLIST